MGNRLRYICFPRSALHFTPTGNHSNVSRAEQNEAAVVTGTDLSPIQPAYVPPNCCFEIDDIEDEWAWTDKFDYIHGRYITPFLKDVPKMLRNAYDNLNPGGWFEVMEGVMWFHAVDDTLKGTNLQAWNKLVVDGKCSQPKYDSLKTLKQCARGQP